MLFPHIMIQFVEIIVFCEEIRQIRKTYEPTNAEPPFYKKEINLHLLSRIFRNLK